MADDKRNARKEKDRERHLREIQDAALVLFARKGYQGTTIEDIATELGYAKASLYYYFSGKEAIVRSLIMEAMAESGRRMDELLARSSDPVANLRDLFEDYIDGYTDSHGFYNIYHQVGDFMDSVLGEEDRRRMALAMAEMSTRIIGIMRRGIDAGRFVDMDPQVLGEMLLGMVSGLMRQVSGPRMKGWDRAAMKGPVLDLLMRSVLKTS